MKVTATERYPFMNTTLSPVDCFDTRAAISLGSQHQPSSNLVNLGKAIHVDDEEAHTHSYNSHPQPSSVTAADDSLSTYILLMNNNRRNSFNAFSNLETIYEEDEQPKKSNQPLY